MADRTLRQIAEGIVSGHPEWPTAATAAFREMVDAIESALLAARTEGARSMQERAALHLDTEADNSRHKAAQVQAHFPNDPMIATHYWCAGEFERRADFIRALPLTETGDGRD